MSAAPDSPMWRDRTEPPGEHVAVSRHAELSLLERLDPMERYPAARLRRLWARSDPSRHPSARDVTAAGERFRIIFDRHGGDTVALLTIYSVHREGGA